MVTVSSEVFHEMGDSSDFAGHVVHMAFHPDHALRHSIDVVIDVFMETISFSTSGDRMLITLSINFSICSEVPRL